MLDAEGVLPRRSQKKKAEKKTQRKATEKKAEQVDPVAAGNVARKDSEASSTSEAADADDGEEESSDEESGDTWVAVDPPHGKSPPVLKRVTPAETSAGPSFAQKAVVPTAQSPASDSGSDQGKLSKADRKALKKRLIEERMKRQQDKTSHW